MTHLIFIRHSISRQIPGTSAHQWELTDEGRARCADLAAALTPYRVNRIASSDEPKALQTAEVVASHLSLETPLIIEPEFGETRRATAPYFDSNAEFAAAVKRAIAQPDAVVFGEESFNDARKRFIDALSRLVERYPDETLAVVTHGTVLSLVLEHYAGIDAYETWQSLKMPAYAVLTPNLELLDLQYSL